MQIQAHWLDVTQHLASGIQPVFMLERPLLRGDKPRGGLFASSEVARRGRYWVAAGDLLSAPVRWSLVHTGQYVRVPVFAYKTSSRALSAILAMGVMLGMRGADSVRGVTAEEIVTAVMVLGHECADTGDGFRTYVGLAFETKG